MQLEAIAAHERETLQKRLTSMTSYSQAQQREEPEGQRYGGRGADERASIREEKYGDSKVEDSKPGIDSKQLSHNSERRAKNDFQGELTVENASMGLLEQGWLARHQSARDEIISRSRARRVKVRNNQKSSMFCLKFM